MFARRDLIRVPSRIGRAVLSECFSVLTETFTVLAEFFLYVLILGDIDPVDLCLCRLSVKQV